MTRVVGSLTALFIVAVSIAICVWSVPRKEPRSFAVIALVSEKETSIDHVNSMILLLRSNHVFPKIVDAMRGTAWEARLPSGPEERAAYLFDRLEISRELDAATNVPTNAIRVSFRAEDPEMAKTILAI